MSEHCQAADPTLTVRLASSDPSVVAVATAELNGRGEEIANWHRFRDRGPDYAEGLSRA